MLKTLVRNTLFSGLAYLSVGLIGFLLVPVLVGAYGMAGFGLIVLARTLLPTGPLSVMDFGVSETTTQTIARARSDLSWRRASGQLTLLLLIATAMGTVVGLVLILIGPHLDHFVHVGAPFRTGFIQVVRVTGAASPILFAGLVVEGMTKGFERYGLLRALEVLGTVFFVLAAWVLTRAGKPFQTVALTYLGIQVARGLFLLGTMVPRLWNTPLRLGRWDRDMFQEVRHRSVLMFQSRVLGVLQSQSPPLFIGALVGPAGVGVYDVLVRLPRFAKAVLSLLISALLPVSARLDVSADRRKLADLGRAGYWLMPLLAFPPLMGGAIFSRELLREWMGPSVSTQWPWLSLMFIVPLLGILLSYGQTLMQVRVSYLRVNNRLQVLMVALQLVISVALVTRLKEKAFIFGQVAALIVIFPSLLRALLKEQAFPFSIVGRVMTRHALVALPLGMAAVACKGGFGLPGPVSLGVAFSVWCVSYWGLAYYWILNDDERDKIFRVFVSLGGKGNRSGRVG